MVPRESKETTSDTGTEFTRGVLELVLRDIEWTGWGRFCSEMGGFFRLGAEEYTQTTIEHLESQLLSPGYFRTAHCTLDDNSERITCDLLPQPIIRDSDVSGHVPFPLLKRTLRQRIFLRSGSLLLREEEQLRRQADRLSTYMREEGFFETSVQAELSSVGGVPPNLGKSLRTHVKGGRSFELGTVTITGDAIVSDHDARDAVRHFWIPWLVDERFRPSTFREDLRGLEAVLRNRGWPEARVAGDYTLDDEEGSVNVVLHINSGPKIELAFEGNSSIKSGKLRDLAKFKESGAADAVEIDNLRRAIRHLYQTKGFDSVEVMVTTERPDPAHMELRYHIEEGPQRHISLVQLSGNESLSEQVLHDKVDLLTRTPGLFTCGCWVDDWVEHDVRELRRYYLEQGFTEVDVEAQRTALPDGTLQVSFVVHEGLRTVVAEVDFQGVPADVTRDALLESMPLLRGAPFREDELANSEFVVRSTLAAHGYLDAEVVQRIVVRESGALALQSSDLAGPTEVGRAASAQDIAIAYDITAGRRHRFGGFLARGNFRTSSDIIEQALDLSPGDPMDLLAIGKAEQQLRGLGIFDSVEINRLSEDNDGNNWLLVALQERDVLTLDAVMGFTTDDLFSIGADYRDGNLFGRSLNAALSVRIGNSYEYLSPKMRIGNVDRGTMLLRAPRPLGLPFDISYSGSFSHENKRLFVRTQRAARVALERLLLDRTSCGLCPQIMGTVGYELTSSNLRSFSEVPTGVILPPDATIARLFVSFAVDRTDSLMDPRRGYSLAWRAELALPWLTGPLGGHGKFWRVLNSGAGYVPLGIPLAFQNEKGERLGGPVVVMVGVNHDLSHPIGAKTNIPEFETFYYGGDYSVRGAREGASLPGRLYLFTATTELRWYFLQNLSFGSFQLAGFADLGTAARAEGQLFQETTVSTGATVRYVTPIGPLSVGYGWAVVRPKTLLLRHPSALPASGRLHITFGSTF